MILGIVLHALYLMENNAELPMILACWFVVCVLYFYGWYVGEFCFGPEGETWHACLHLLSSFGHHLVILNT